MSDLAEKLKQLLSDLQYDKERLWHEFCEYDNAETMHEHESVKYAILVLEGFMRENEIIV